MKYQYATREKKNGRTENARDKKIIIIKRRNFSALSPQSTYTRDIVVDLRGAASVVALTPRRSFTMAGSAVGCIIYVCVRRCYTSRCAIFPRVWGKTTRPRVVEGNWRGKTPRIRIRRTTPAQEFISTHTPNTPAQYCQQKKNFLL